MTDPVIDIRTGGHMVERVDPRDESGRSMRVPTIALAFPWVAAREDHRAVMPERRRVLGLTDPLLLEPTMVAGVRAREFGATLPNDLWADLVFGWLAEEASPERVGLLGVGEGPAAWCMQVQAATLLPEDPWPIFRAIFEALPPAAEIVSFCIGGPANELGAALVGEGVRMMTTADACVGVCWAMRGPTMLAFHDWRGTKLRDGWRTPNPRDKGLPYITEDTMIGLFGLVTGRRIWHPLPAVAARDMSMSSVGGNEAHRNRTPLVDWRDAERFGGAWDRRELESVEFWRGGRARVATPLGMRTGYNASLSNRPWRDVGFSYVCGDPPVEPTVARLAARWVDGYTPAEYYRARLDNGRHERRLLSYAVRAKQVRPPRARVLICTPTRGGLEPRYVSALLRLQQAFDVDVVNGAELLGAEHWHENLVVVRSRFVRKFLLTDATHLLFADADVPPEPAAVWGMLRADRDLVITPYPRRDGVNWRAVRRAFEAGIHEEIQPAEAVAYEYPVRFLADVPPVADDRGCVEVEFAPLGCALLSRGLLERMTEHYVRDDAIDDPAMDAESWREGYRGHAAVDLQDGQPVRMALLFPVGTMARPELGTDARVPHSEDIGFCRLARHIGERVYLYLGPGSPADHIGPHVFGGHIEHFGLRRLSPEQAAEEHRACAAAPLDDEPLTPEDVAALAEADEDIARGDFGPLDPSLLARD